jgi:hypothetical protein
MDTTIKNNEQGNNSIIPCSFTWSAIFRNGSKTEQFNQDGTENLFRLVKDRFNELAYFNLKNNTGKMFTVNLIEGIIGYNRLEFPYIEAKEKKNNIRLIFFRRHFVTIGTGDLKEKKHTIEYHLGIQWTTLNNENRNIILQISENGEFIINGK